MRGVALARKALTVVSRLRPVCPFLVSPSALPPPQLRPSKSASTRAVRMVRTDWITLAVFRRTLRCAGAEGAVHFLPHKAHF